MHALYSHVAYLVLQYFSTLFHKQHHFQKKVIEHKSVFLFSLELSSGKFLLLRRNEQDTIIILLVSHTSISYCQILMKHEFSRQIFDKYSKYKIS